MNQIWRDKKAIFLFLLPSAILFVGIIIIPIIMSLDFSFYKWDGITAKQFIGFKNYVDLFTSKSAGFPKTVWNAIILAALSVCIQLPLALFLAIALANGVKGEKFFAALFFTPVLISTVVIGQLWMKIYNPTYGMLNTILTRLGLDGLVHSWLGDKSTALMSVFIPILWQYVGYHMLLMYAGIKSQPVDLKEAAVIDGASPWQMVKYITIPLLKPVLQVCTIFAVTGSLKAFDLIYVLTNGGPAHASEVPATLMVTMIFGRGKYGFGSTIAIFIIFLCFFFAILIKKLFRTEAE